MTKHKLMVLAAAIAVCMFCPLAAARRIVGSSPHKVSGLRMKEGAQTVSLSSASRKRGNFSDPLLVGNILDTSVHEGCGCDFQLPVERRARSNRYFFVTDQNKRAWMNIDGQDLELRLIGADHMSLKSRKGQSAQFRFVATGVNVRVIMLVTRTSTFEIDYEPARYAVTVQVVKGNHRLTVRTTGTCGC